MEMPTGCRSSAGSARRRGSCPGKVATPGTGGSRLHVRCGRTQPPQGWQKVGKYGLAPFPSLVRFMERFLGLSCESGQSFKGLLIIH